MTPEAIAFLDSGVGGLPYLAHARRLLPGRRLVYVADRENFPYGEKDRAAIVAAALSVAGRLIQRERPGLVVVACNTMSVVALQELRAQFAVPFVGVVPAVKPAASLSKRKRVGVLATRQTVEGEYLRNLIVQHASGCDVVSLSSSALVEFVEMRLYLASPRERKERVREEVDRFLAERIDALVLGCTHFLHLETEFRRFLDAEGITLVDSRDGVTRQAVRKLKERVPIPASFRPPLESARDSDSLYVTGPLPLEERYQWFARQFGLQLRGGL
ncbi:MAG: glutamate racemase [Spirochaetia bacterium]|jgi:glutamate racemase